MPPDKALTKSINNDTNKTKERNKEKLIEELSKEDWSIAVQDVQAFHNIFEYKLVNIVDASIEQRN